MNMEDPTSLPDIDLSNIPDIDPNSPESSAPPQLSPPFDASNFPNSKSGSSSGGGGGGGIEDLEDLEDMSLNFSTETENNSNSLIVALNARINSQNNNSIDKNHQNSSSNNNDSVTIKKVIPETSLAGDKRKMGSKSGHKKDKKGAAALASTLTGSYWQIPENKYPANRPRREKAGALMTTKSRLRNIKKEKDDDSKDSGTKQTTRGAGNKSPNKKSNEDLIALAGMLVSKKSAIKCVLSIPDTLVPTPHEEFLEQYVEFFDEEELFELFKLIKGRSKTNCTSTSPKRRRFEQFRHSKLFIASRQRKLSVTRRRPSNNSSGSNKVVKLKIKEEIKTENVTTAAAATTTTTTTTTTATVTTKSSPPPVSTLLRTDTQPLPLTIKDENNQEASPPRPRSSFHRKKFEDDEKTPYVKLGTNEILINGEIIIVDHVNYKCEKDVDIMYDDYEFTSECPSSSSSEQQPSVSSDSLTNKQDGKQKKSLELAATVAAASVDSNRKSTEEMLKMNGGTECTSESNSKTKCTLPYCALGCVCDSLKSERGAREHCGKLKCMIDCGCQQGSSWNSDDIKSRLRPRVSLLNWSNRLNYPEAYSQERELLSSKGSGDSNGVLRQYGRMKRPINPPKRNSDFVLHSPAKKRARGDDDSARPLTRQVSRVFNVIGNRFRSLSQRHYAASTNENLTDASTSSASSRNNNMRRVGLDKITKPAIQRAKQLQRNIALRPPSQVSRTRRYISKKAVEGTGDLIPPEYMAKMIPFMEIHARSPPSKTLPLSSESESSDDENDEEDVKTTYTTERFSNSLPVFVENKEDSVVPVILSYKSCRDGFSEIVYNPEKANESNTPSTCA